MGIIKKIQYNSPVILSFTIISLIVFIVSYFTNGLSNTLLFSIYRSTPDDILFYLRLFTHILGHSNFNHYFNNFVIILLVGPMLEEKYGSKNILLMIIFTSFITGIIHVIFSDAALLGASGIGFMFIVLSSFVNIKKGKIPVTLIVFIFIFIGREIVNGIYSDNNISYMTHIIGGVCGVIFGFFCNKNKSLKTVEEDDDYEDEMDWNEVNYD